MEAVKELIRTSKVISGDKWDDISSVGQLLEAVKNAKDQDLTDGRVLKEMFQKIQLLDLLMLILVLTGTFLTFRSVPRLLTVLTISTTKNSSLTTTGPATSTCT